MNEPQALSDMLEDIVTGIARTMAVLGNQLADRGLIDRALLIADLESEQTAMQQDGVGVYGQLISAAAAGALRPRASAQPGGSSPPRQR